MLLFLPRLRFFAFFASQRATPSASALHPSKAVLLLSLWLAVVCNVPLWRAVAALPGQDSLRGWGFALAFALIVTAGNAALLSLLAWRLTLKPAATVLLLMAAFGAYFMLAYGIVIDASMLTNALQTDFRESRDLLNWRLPVTVLALSAPPLLWLQRRPLQRLSALRQLGHNALVLVLALATIVASVLLVFQDFSSTMRNHTQLRYLINPLNSVYALGDIAAHRLNPENHTLQPVGRDAQLGASYAGQSAAQAPLLVLVLGETGRSGNYETLLDVLQRAGLAVLWVDNQSGCKGVCDRVEHTSTQCPSGECLDSVLLKDLDERIAALPAERRARGTVVVLHQMGSHGPAYYKRSAPEAKQFLPECRSSALQECAQQHIVNAYDNSIVATDALLDSTINWLQTQSNQAQAAMVYVADHGESLGENNLYLHGLPYAIAPDVQKQVPWITWLSPALQTRSSISTACLQRNLKERHITHDAYFHSVLGLLDVRSSVYQPELDIYASCRQPTHS